MMASGHLYFPHTQQSSGFSELEDPYSIMKIKIAKRPSLSLIPRGQIELWARKRMKADETISRLQ
jgi:hypothetical protein